MWRRLVWGAVLAFFCVAATLSVPAGHPVRPMDAGGWLLLVVSAFAAVWAPVALVPVLVVTALAPVGYYALGYQGIFAPAPATVAVLFAVLLGRGAYAVAAASVVCLGSYAAGLGHGLTPGAAAVGPLWVLGWMAAAAGAGEALRKRRQLLEQERLRAETAAARGAEQERLRIARELHDSLTHSISVINVQAAVAGHLLEREPERIPGALETIRQASSDALHELRSTVEVLRRIDPGADPADEPGPSLARLEPLVAGSRAAGLSVAVTVRAADALPPEVDRAAYRIVQEALSNAARHAPGAHVVVEIGRRGQDFEVTVRNGPARGAPDPRVPPGSGQGLVGMRERVDTIGGALHTGAHEGGFRVRAVLPLPGADPGTTPKEPPA
ncbi:sensor histidine kinase [Streptomyces sp. HNM1019]|uniref:sensor histidine kinase n=1 Tax=Streptomyces sp. HNM1019 TaxID=3424717 RepID=UPI003D77C1D2